MYGILRKDIKLQKNKCNYFKSHSFAIAKKQQGKKTSQRMKKKLQTTI